MKNMLFFCCIILVVCTGCPMSVSYPVEGTTIKYDKTILGNYHSQSEELKISNIDDKSFKVYYNNHSDSEPTTIDGKGSFITSRHNTYLLLAYSENDEAKYMIFQVHAYSVGKDKLDINAMDEDKVKELNGNTDLKSTEELNKFLAAHPEAFSEQMTFERDK